MNEAAARPSETPTRVTARALIVGERIDTAGLERPDMISSLPLAFRVGPAAWSRCSASASRSWSA